MTPELITAIIVAIIAAIGGQGLYQYLGRRKDQPIKETEVDITVATSINKVALDTLAAVGGISQGLRKDLSSQKEAFEKTNVEHGHRLKCLESKLKELQDVNRLQDIGLNGWRTWYAGIERDWNIVRQAPQAPPPPAGEINKENRHD